MTANADFHLCRNIAGIAGLILLAACAAPQTYAPAPLQPAQVFQTFTAQRLDSAAVHEFLRQADYPLAQWPLPDWDAQALVLAGLALHPEMQVARAEWALRQAGEQTAAQRINPGFELPLEWHSDTSGGASPWLIGAVLDIVLERRGKRAARIDQASMRTLAARIAIENTAWRIRSSILEALLAYGQAQSATALHTRRVDAIKAIYAVLERRETLGEVSRFELSSTRLALQQARLQLTEQAQSERIAYDALAAAIGVLPEALDQIDISTATAAAMTAVDTSELPLPDLRGLALQHRHDIRRALAEYAVVEAGVRLAIEQQYPDVNLSPGFLFDQGDKIWQLAASWVLPLFHRHEGEIAEALAQRELAQQQFLLQQARIIEQVQQARSAYLSHEQIYTEAEALYAEASDFREQLQRQLAAGYSNRLQLLRAETELLDAELARLQTAQRRQRAWLQLEDALQYPLQDSADLPALGWLLETDVLETNNP
ncbi:MAG: TolC family protein [Gammaproteobacteria bacterium]